MTVVAPVIAAAEAERLEIVVTQERMAGVASAWRDLWQRVDGLIFQSYDWIEAWWSTVPDCDQRRLRIGLLWQGERLVAVMPLAISRRKGFAFLEWAAMSVTDYGDILMAPECSLTSLGTLWGRLCAQGGFDLVYLNRLLPDARARALLDLATSGVTLKPNHRQEVSYRVAGQWTSGDMWFAQQSKKTRKSYRHGLNTLTAEGEMRFRLLPDGEPLGPVLDRIAHLKRQWLTDSGKQSQLFDEQATAIAALVKVLSDAGILRIFVLECNGMPISMSVNLVQHNKMMAFVTTFDPAFAQASPGVLLMMDYIKWSLDHGLEMVDFLCGGEPFKQRFATGFVTLESVMGSRTVKGALAMLADNLRQAIRERQRRRASQETPVSENADPADEGVAG